MHIFVVFGCFLLVFKCSSAAPAAKLGEVEKELELLKQDGAVIHKSEHVVLNAVNGENKMVDQKEETISNAKTGQKVAQISQVSQKDRNQPMQKTTEIKIPSAGIDEKTETGKENKQIMESVKQAELYDQEKRDAAAEEQMEMMQELKKIQIAEEERADALGNLKQMTESLIQSNGVQRQLRDFLDDLRQSRDRGNVDAMVVLHEYLRFLDAETNAGRLEPEAEKEIVEFIDEMDSEEAADVEPEAEIEDKHPENKQRQSERPRK